MCISDHIVLFFLINSFYVPNVMYFAIYCFFNIIVGIITSGLHCEGVDILYISVSNSGSC